MALYCFFLFFELDFHFLFLPPDGAPVRHPPDRALGRLRQVRVHCRVEEGLEELQLVEQEDEGAEADGEDQAAVVLHRVRGNVCVGCQKGGGVIGGGGSGSCINLKKGKMCRMSLCCKTNQIFLVHWKVF